LGQETFLLHYYDSPGRPQIPGGIVGTWGSLVQTFRYRKIPRIIDPRTNKSCGSSSLVLMILCFLELQILICQVLVGKIPVPNSQRSNFGGLNLFLPLDLNQPILQTRYESGAILTLRTLREPTERTKVPAHGLIHIFCDLELLGQRLNLLNSDSKAYPAASELTLCP